MAVHQLHSTSDLENPVVGSQHAHHQGCFINFYPQIVASDGDFNTSCMFQRIQKVRAHSETFKSVPVTTSQINSGTGCILDCLYLSTNIKIISHTNKPNSRNAYLLQHINIQTN